MVAFTGTDNTNWYYNTTGTSAANSSTGGWYTVPYLAPTIRWPTRSRTPSPPQRSRGMKLEGMLGLFRPDFDDVVEVSRRKIGDLVKVIFNLISRTWAQDYGRHSVLEVMINEEGEVQSWHQRNQ